MVAQKQDTALTLNCKVKCREKYVRSSQIRQNLRYPRYLRDLQLANPLPAVCVLFDCVAEFFGNARLSLKK